MEDRPSFHFVQAKFTVEVGFSFCRLSVLSMLSVWCLQPLWSPFAMYGIARPPQKQTMGTMLGLHADVMLSACRPQRQKG